MKMIANVSRLSGAALAVALLVGPVAAAEIGEPVLGLQSQPVVNLGNAYGASSAVVPNLVYDSTNQVVSAATSSTDLKAIYGDELVMAGGVGENVSAVKFGVYCSGSSTALVSATETIRFYDLTNAGAFLGGFTVALGALPPSYYSIYTTTGIENVVMINLPSIDLLVTQQLSSVVGATRMGTVLSYTNAPAVGSTNSGFYMSHATAPANWYVITGQTYSNLQYALETMQSPVPTESQSWGSLKAEYR